MRWRRGSRSTVRSGQPLGHGRRTGQARKGLPRYRRVPRPLVVDCLTLWVANLLAAGYDDDAALAAASAVAALCAGRPGRVIVVSNEVGSGIVPTDSSLSRRYRDLLGQVNMVFAARAEDAFLVVAGRVLPLLPRKPHSDEPACAIPFSDRATCVRPWPSSRPSAAGEELGQHLRPWPISLS